MCLGCMDIPLKWLSYISRECKRQLLITVKYRMVEKTRKHGQWQFSTLILMNEREKLMTFLPKKLFIFFLFKEEFAIIKR